MKMHDIEFADLVMKCPAQSWRPIESSDQGDWEISDLNTVKIHWRCDWSGSNSRPVTVSGKDLQFMPSCRQCSAEAMDRKNRPSIAHGGEIGRNDMEDSHCPTLQEIDRSPFSLRQ
jgi:hypothetical protein